jgi:hypothetical protein
MRCGGKKLWVMKYEELSNRAYYGRMHLKKRLDGDGVLAG